MTNRVVQYKYNQFNNRRVTDGTPRNADAGKLRGSTLVYIADRLGNLAKRRVALFVLQEREKRSRQMDFAAWNGFKKGEWSEKIDVRDFIRRNYTPYLGDASFLAGPT